MLNLTPLLRGRFVKSAKTDEAVDSREAIRREQFAVLDKLTARGAKTDYGRRHGIAAGMSYEDFASRVPVSDYPDMRPWVERMLRGESDVLWPGRCVRFAQSSGTSDGKSKYIPVTDDSLRLNHYAGSASVVAHYLRRNTESKMFGGKSFILGGSFANELKNLPPGVKVGDLSASLIDDINPVVNILRVPTKKVALM